MVNSDFLYRNVLAERTLNRIESFCRCCRVIPETEVMGSAEKLSSRRVHDALHVRIHRAVSLGCGQFRVHPQMGYFDHVFQGPSGCEVLDHPTSGFFLCPLFPKHTQFTASPGNSSNWRSTSAKLSSWLGKRNSSTSMNATHLDFPRRNSSALL